MAHGVETRVIDTNEMMIRRLESLKAILNPLQDEYFELGLPEGLDAEQVAALLGESELGEFTDNNFAEGNIGNVFQDGIRTTSPSIIKAIPPQPTVDIEAMISDAQAEIEQMKSDALAKMEQLKNDTYTKAKKSGYEDGFHEGKRKAEAMQQEIEAKSLQLDNAYESKINELEPIFVDTLTGIYEHIFHVELKSHREIILHLLTNTISKIEGNRDFIIHVSKDDYPYVSMHKRQITTDTISANSSVEIIEDLTLNKNECLIETDGGIFDCGLGTQLTELEKELKLLSYTK